jgi:hypothetical protein
VDFVARKDLVPNAADFRSIFTRTEKGQRFWSSRESRQSHGQFVFWRTHWTSILFFDIMGCGGSKPKTGKGPFFLSVGSGKRVWILRPKKLCRPFAAQLSDTTRSSLPTTFPRMMPFCGVKPPELFFRVVSLGFGSRWPSSWPFSSPAVLGPGRHPC